MIVLLLGLASLRERTYVAASTTVSIAGVTLLMTSVFAISNGMEDVLERSAPSGALIAMAVGSEREAASWIPATAARRLLGHPEFARHGDSTLAAMEVYDVLSLPKRSTRSNAHVGFRGVQPSSALIRDGFRIESGRAPQLGKFEVLVGVRANDEFHGLQVGDVIEWRRLEWIVAGHFSANGSVAESEVWGDLSLMRPALGMEEWVHTVHARVDSSEAMRQLEADISADKDLNVTIRTYADFYGRQAEALTTAIKFVGRIALTLLGLCATFAAINTMFATASMRMREIAVLRAIGFGRILTTSSVVAEAVLLAAVGGALGVAGAFLWLDGVQTSTMSRMTYSQLSFFFSIGSSDFLFGVAYAASVGFVGSLPAGLWALRYPMSRALRTD